MAARAPSPFSRRTTASCACAARTHPQADALDGELRLLGRPGNPDGQTLASLANRYGINHVVLSLHRSRHLGLPPLPRGRAAIVPNPNPPSPLNEEDRKLPRRPVDRAKTELSPLPSTAEGKHAQLVKTIATLISLGSYRGISTIRALAARHGVGEEEVVRAHRRASLSVRDARGSLREQLELSIGVLTQIRDQERKVADDYTGIAERLVVDALPSVDAQGRTAAAKRVAHEDELERARTARSIAAQAQDNAIAAQKQIDQNTIHRRTAPLVQVSFSASPDFTKAHDALVILLCAFVGDGRAEEAKEVLARGLQVLEDAGENLDSPEFLEYLAEVRRDGEALTVDATVTPPSSPCPP